MFCVAALALVVAGCGSSPSFNDKDTPEKLYADARDEMSSGNYDKAIKILERVEGRAAGSLLAQQAQLDQAYAQWKSGERATALATLDRFIKVHPSSPALDYAMYLKGIINFNDNLGIFSAISRQDISERDQQASRDAYQAFKQLVDQFPESKYSADARVRMNYIVNALAQYELHVARYYYRRGAFLAAANRAQQTVRDYQQTPSIEEALYILAQSYDKLGLNELRDDADRVLKQNYPDSRFLREGMRKPDTRWWQWW
jgi:outer membrane protein assembly factor BamD